MKANAVVYSGLNGAQLSFLVGVLIFLYLPIAYLIVYAFTDSPVPNMWTGFSVSAFRDLINDGEIASATSFSLKIAMTAASVSTLLGFLTAYTLQRNRDLTGRAFFNGMSLAPLVMPRVVIAIGLLLLMVTIQRAIGAPDRGFLTIVVGHTVVGTAFATLIIQARLVELNLDLEEAAMDLGARPIDVFLLVTLPMIGQSLISAWLLSFTLSMDDVVLAAFLSGPGTTTLPLVLFSRAKLGLNPSVNAVATFVVVVVSIGVITASYAIARAERRRQLEMAEAARH
jgi:putrescine transport system permease protein